MILLVKMVDHSSLIMVLPAFIRTIDAYLISGITGPTPASYNKINEDGWTPKPTQAPMQFGSIQERDLFGRQEAGQICGYINAISSESVYCDAGYACRVETDPNYLMCCETNAAGSFIQYFTAAILCEDYNGTYNLNTPTTFEETVSCPYSSPNCATYSIFGISSGDTMTYSNFKCTTGTDLVFSVYPTVNDFNSNIPSSTSSSLSSTYISSTSSPISAPPISNTSSPPISSPSSSDTGAIAGGVVGAVAGIIIVAGAVFFLCRRKRKQRKQSVPEISVNHTK
ncbi:MAG: hypothetical protein FE78DRAFT_73257 [Acidomyces sp. 'richmondensis']|nr:MAG: hypothetical protein FE78DRAFT_73257 [Acidomyces sp. 'richmondensis']